MNDYAVLRIQGKPYNPATLHLASSFRRLRQLDVHIIICRCLHNLLDNIFSYRPGACISFFRRDAYIFEKRSEAFWTVYVDPMARLTGLVSKGVHGAWRQIDRLSGTNDHWLAIDNEIHLTLGYNEYLAIPLVEVWRRTRRLGRCFSHDKIVFS